MPEIKATMRTANSEQRTANSEQPNHYQNFPVRIAHIVGKMRNGGVESVIMNYYRNIDREKIQYDFIIDEDSDNPQFQQEIKTLGGKIITVPPYQKPLAYHKALYKIFTSNKYPLVYSHINTLSVFPLFAAWRAGVKIRVAHNHSTAGQGEFLRNIMKYTLRNFSKTFSTEYCACSKLAGQWLFGKHTDFLIWPNAIELERFAYDKTLRDEMRKFLKLEDKFVVGHAGRFMNQKNHKFLIDIFAEIHRIKSDAVLLLAGDGPLMDEITHKVMDLGLNESVIFLGSVHDMEKYYQAMDVFILPSFYEGLPVVGSEVQVSGLPFLCADTVTSETKFCDNMKFLSLRKSAHEWAQEALKLCEGHQRRDMSEEARAHGFDVKVQAAKMTKWYCRLLGI